ncbi:leucine-rich repeat domain-containing protein [Catellatospora methionotrophica]|uniref:leucine-rich repeat domain-containing protein n=1 Tax=Catellatospora methionotrophica TaxID=121620 RepID=UPI00340A5B0A
MKYVTVRDLNLIHALRAAVGNDLLTDESLQNVTQLDWSEYRAEAGLPWGSIRDLTGIEYCINVRALSLDGNGIKSLLPLAGLSQLKEVWLVQNEVRDLKPLVGLANLTTLVLEMNYKLKNVAPLAGLPDLEYLNIASTGVADLAPLVDLPALARLAWNPTTAITGGPMTGPALRRAEAVLDTLRARGVQMERYGRAT